MRFDWHSDPITDKTVIDQYYKNTQNVRRYFKSQCGEHFSFNREFMQWMKDNRGQTMKSAVVEWKRSEGLAS